MSRQYEDIKDLILDLFTLFDYARLGMKVSTYNSCNNCKDEECKYRPDWGDSVRWNCPLWTAEGKNNSEE